MRISHVLFELLQVSFHVYEYAAYQHSPKSKLSVSSKPSASSLLWFMRNRRSYADLGCLFLCLFFFHRVLAETNCWSAVAKVVMCCFQVGKNRTDSREQSRCNRISLTLEDVIHSVQKVLILMHMIALQWPFILPCNVQ